MFRKNKIEFYIKASTITTTQEILETIESIKKAHPNAKISVEVEV